LIIERCVITGAVRTAVGSYLSSLKIFSAYLLVSYVIEEAIKKCGINKSNIDQVIIGDVRSKASNLARISLLIAVLEE